MRGGGHLREVFAGAVTLVEQSTLLQSRKRRFVGVLPPALIHERIPIQPEGREVLKLAGVKFGPCSLVKIFHAHDESGARSARNRPRDHRRPEISEVEISGWRGRVTASARQANPSDPRRATRSVRSRELAAALRVGGRGGSPLRTRADRTRNRSW